MSDLLVIIGGHLREAEYWCRQWGLNPRDRRIILLTSPRQLYGLRDIRLAYVGNWATSRSLNETAEIIDRIGILRATGRVRAWLPPTKGSAWPTTN